MKIANSVYEKENPFIIHAVFFLVFFQLIDIDYRPETHSLSLFELRML